MWVITGPVSVIKCEELSCTYIINVFDYTECVNNVCPIPSELKT